MAYNHDRLFEAIDKRLSETPRVSLKTLARELKVGRHTLMNVVKQARDVSFAEFQKQKTLEKATELLGRRGTLSIKEIALRLGYKAPQSLTRFMKAATGDTPTGLRPSRRKQVKVIA